MPRKPPILFPQEQRLLHPLHILWADPRAANQYRAHHLDAADAVRVKHGRAPRARLDWQVSRALLQGLVGQAQGRVRSLSHSHGHAVCLTAPAAWRVGVDIELMRPRAVLSLADWVCSGTEARWLRQVTAEQRLQRFYLLWTVKEALIKGTGLAFPADMPRVGLQADAHGGWHLQAPPGAWRACTWQLGSDWVVSAVWQAPEPVGAMPHWRAMEVSPLPEPSLLGAWSSGNVQ